MAVKILALPTLSESRGCPLHTNLIVYSAIELKNFIYGPKHLQIWNYILHMISKTSHKLPNTYNPECGLYTWFQNMYIWPRPFQDQNLDSTLEFENLKYGPEYLETWM